MKKISAFSLMEIIVVLLLSAIIMSMAFQGYQVFSKYYKEYNQATLEAEDINQLHTLLTKYTLTSKKITHNSSSIYFHFEKEVFEFSFKRDFLLSTIHDRVDTFFCTTQDLHFFWLEEEQFVSGELVDEFSFQVVTNKTYPFAFKKQYDTQTYFEIDIQK